MHSERGVDGGGGRWASPIRAFVREKHSVTMRSRIKGRNIFEAADVLNEVVAANILRAVIAETEALRRRFKRELSCLVFQFDGNHFVAPLDKDIQMRDTVSG